jgi:transposase
VREARQQWHTHVAQIDPRRLVFIDESGARTNMTRLYGRAAVGRRVRDAVPTAHWSTTTMIAAVRADGAGAPMLLEGPIDGLSFDAWTEQVLVPELRPGDVVVLDNLSTHKHVVARARIQAAGASVLDLPPYSPDLNPIEKMWSKIKAFLRGAKARSFDELAAAFAAALRAVTAQDIRGWFQSCGYTII